MSSRGSPRIIFRVSPELLGWLEERVQWSKTNRRAGEHTLTSLLIELIEEGRAKRERSRTWRQRKKARQQQEGRA